MKNGATNYIRFRGDPVEGSPLRLATNDCERGKFSKRAQVRRASVRIIGEMRNQILAGCTDLNFYPSYDTPWRSDDPDVDDIRFRIRVLDYAFDELACRRDDYPSASVHHPDFLKVHGADSLSLTLVAREFERLKELKPRTSVNSIKSFIGVGVARFFKAIEL